MPEGGQLCSNVGLGLRRAWVWEVTARNPEQKAPGSTSGLVSALTGADTQERPPITPWCPGTNTYPDLGIRALKNLILYIENPKDSTRKLLELINEYSKVVGYKINTEIPCIPIH